MGTIESGSGEISQPKRPQGLAAQEVAVLASMYFTEMLNHRFRDLVGKNRDAEGTRMILEALQHRGMVWKDRLNVYHLTPEGAQKVVELPEEELESILANATISLDAPEPIPVDIRPMRFQGCAIALLMLLLWTSATWGMAAILDRVAGAIGIQTTDALEVGIVVLSAVINAVLFAAFIVAAASPRESSSKDDAASQGDPNHRHDR